MMQDHLDLHDEEKEEASHEQAQGARENWHRTGKMYNVCACNRSKAQ